MRASESESETLRGTFTWTEKKRNLFVDGLLIATMFDLFLRVPPELGAGTRPAAVLMSRENQLGQISDQWLLHFNNIFVFHKKSSITG